MISRFITALQFLTTITISKSYKTNEQTYGECTMFYPIVGILLGLILIGLNIILSMFLHREIVDIFLLLSLTILTGGLHLDGLCDLVDAYKGGTNKETIITIMKDTHVGAMGVVGVIFLILIKYAALTNIPLDLKNTYLVIAPTIGRWSILQMVFTSRYARTTNGLGSPLIKYTTTKGLILGLTTTLLPTILLLEIKGIIIWIISVIFTLWFTKHNEEKIGGVTGDIMGATCELNETLILILGCVKW